MKKILLVLATMLSQSYAYSAQEKILELSTGWDKQAEAELVCLKLQNAGRYAYIDNLNIPGLSYEYVVERHSSAGEYRLRYLCGVKIILENSDLILTQKQVTKKIKRSEDPEAECLRLLREHSQKDNYIAGTYNSYSFFGQKCDLDYITVE